MTFEEKCDWLRRTSINESMTYEERFAMLKARYGV